MRMAVSSSPGFSTVMRVMSMAGSDEIVFGIDHALALRAANHHLRVERDQRRRGVGRIHGHAAVRAAEWRVRD